MTVSSKRNEITAETAINNRRIAHARLNSALALISPAARVSHSGSSLWDHLLGTFEILCAWGAAPDVSLAGLVHSIYATQFFTTAVVRPERRKDVARAVGARVERLAHLFCVIDRQAIRTASIPSAASSSRLPVRVHASDRPVRLSRATLRELRVIDLANELEQRQRIAGPPTAWLAEFCSAFRAIGFWPAAFRPDGIAISRQAEDRLLQHYGEAIRSRGQHSGQLLLHCISDFPRCAEARLLLAAALLKRGDVASAYAHAHVGTHHLRAWGVAWDTRVPLVVWDLLGRELLSAAHQNVRTPPAIVRTVVDRLRAHTRS